MGHEPGAAVRPLPQYPSLERLRKEAKARLKALRLADAGCRLADAQRDVARAYGFPGWRDLKAYVEAVDDVGSVLVEAVRHGDVASVARILDAHPALVDAAVDLAERVRPSDERAMRLLHLAVAESQVDVARLLIARGADLDRRNAGGRTALHDCFELHRPLIKALLIDGGAEIDVCAAAAYAMLDRLDEILVSQPEQANDLRTGLTPLGWAGYGRAAGAARRLIGGGAIIDRPPFDGLAWGPTADVAAAAVAEVLIEHGADPNWQDGDGDTPLHLAIRSRLVGDPAAFVAVMLDGGADPRRRNAAGRSPLDEAWAHKGASAETYVDRRPIGEKRLERTITLLTGRGGRPARK